MTPLPENFSDAYPWHLDRDESIAAGYSIDTSYTAEAREFARGARRHLLAEAREIAMSLGRRVAVMARVNAEGMAVCQAVVSPHPLPAPGHARALLLPDHTVAYDAIALAWRSPADRLPDALRLAALVSRPR